MRTSRQSSFDARVSLEGEASAVPDMTLLVQAKTTNRLERPALPRSMGLGPRAAEIRGAYIPGPKTSGFRGGKRIRETDFG